MAVTAVRGQRPFFSPGGAWLLLLPLLLGAPASSGAAELAVTAVRYWSLGDVTRISVETNGKFTYRTEHLAKPPRVFFDLKGPKPKLSNKAVHTIAVNDKRLRQIRVAENQPGVTRIVLDLEETADPVIRASQTASPHRLLLEVKGKADESPANTLTLSKSDVQRMPKTVAPKVAPEPKRAQPQQPPATASLSLPPPPRAPVPQLPEAPDLVEEDEHADEPATAAASGKSNGPPPRAATKGSTSAQRSLTRTLGLKIRRVVLDPGHGGHDHGTTGPGGLVEKELVLDVTRRLGVLLEQNMGCEVIYTRTTDVFLSLEERAALANQKKADLFLSVHANSSPLRTASGSETYYLSFTTSKADMEVAARENASSERSISELRDLVAKIALREKADESREFAAKIQHSLAKVNLGSQARRNRGVKRAPFVVLVGASMPAVLTEIGFVTNSKEEAQMKKPEFRQRLAEGIYQGIEDYANSLGQQLHVAQTAAAGGSEDE